MLSALGSNRNARSTLSKVFLSLFFFCDSKKLSKRVTTERNFRGENGKGKKIEKIERRGQDWSFISDIVREICAPRHLRNA